MNDNNLIKQNIATLDSWLSPSIEKSSIQPDSSNSSNFSEWNDEREDRFGRQFD